MLTERQFKDLLNRISLHTDIEPDDIIGFEYDGKVFKVTWQWRPKKGAIIAKTRTNWKDQRLMEFSAQELRAELRRRNKKYKRQEKQDDCTDGICKL